MIHCHVSLVLPHPSFQRATMALTGCASREVFYWCAGYVPSFYLSPNPMQVAQHDQRLVGQQCNSLWLGRGSCPQQGGLLLLAQEKALVPKAEGTSKGCITLAILGYPKRIKIKMAASPYSARVHREGTHQKCELTPYVLGSLQPRRHQNGYMTLQHQFPKAAETSKKLFNHYFLGVPRRG